MRFGSGVRRGGFLVLFEDVFGGGGCSVGGLLWWVGSHVKKQCRVLSYMSVSRFL